MPANPNSNQPSARTDQQQCQEHKSLAQSFLRKARKFSAFSTSDEEMAKVCSFYAVYHAMRYVILNDPIFWDEEKLHSIHPQFSSGFRNHTHHSGSLRSGRGPGMNEIITILYDVEVSREYVQLHKESVKVRYGDDGSLDSMSGGECYSAANTLVLNALKGQIVCTKAK